MLKHLIALTLLFLLPFYDEIYYLLVHFGTNDIYEQKIYKSRVRATLYNEYYILVWWYIDGVWCLL